MTDLARLRGVAEELPGYRPLVPYGAAIPFYDCELDLRILARQTLSALEQVVLRCLAQRVDTREALALVLGVGRALLDDALENLLSADLAEPAGGDGEGGMTFTLNDRGTTALAERCFYRPEVVRFRVYFDALTGELNPANRRRFVNEHEARARGLHVLPAHLSEPAPGDFPIREMERVLEETRRLEPRRAPEGTLHDVLAIVRTARVFLPCEVHPFDAPDQSHVVFRVVERGIRLRDHEQTLGAIFPRYQERVLPLVKREEIAPPAVDLAPLIQKADQADAAVAALAERVRSVDAELETAAREDATAPTSDTRRQVASLRAQLARVTAELEEARRERDSVRRVDVAEHRQILLRGLREARHRVIIISPWIQPVAVDDEFLDALAHALRGRVHVVVGWGYPEVMEEMKKERTLHAIRQMRRKAEGVPGRLDVVEHGSTHEKVLIVDRDLMVVTSFNWLSFRGEWGQRQETGLCHRIRSLIDESAEVYLGRLGLSAPIEAVRGPRPRRSGRHPRQPERAAGEPVSERQRERLETRGFRVRDARRGSPGKPEKGGGGSPDGPAR